MIEQPLLGVGDVDGLHDLGDDPLGEIAIAGGSELLDTEPARIFDRSVVEVGHADREARHVVHEEVGEVLGRDHDDRLGFTRLEVDPHLVERRVERIANLGVGEILAAGDARSVAAHPGVHECHFTPRPRIV